MRYFAIGCMLGISGLCFAQVEVVTFENGRRVYEVQDLPPGQTLEEYTRIREEQNAAAYQKYLNRTPEQVARSENFYDSSRKFDMAAELGIWQPPNENGIYETTGSRRIVRDDLITSYVRFQPLHYLKTLENGDRVLQAWQIRESNVWYFGDKKPRFAGRGQPLEVIFKPGVEVTTESVPVRPDFSKRKIILSQPE